MGRQGTRGFGGNEFARKVETQGSCEGYCFVGGRVECFFRSVDGECPLWRGNFRCLFREKCTEVVVEGFVIYGGVV